MCGGWHQDYEDGKIRFKAVRGARGSIAATSWLIGVLWCVVEQSLLLARWWHVELWAPMKTMIEKKHIAPIQPADEEEWKVSSPHHMEDVVSNSFFHNSLESDTETASVSSHDGPPQAARVKAPPQAGKSTAAGAGSGAGACSGAGVGSSAADGPSAGAGAGIRAGSSPSSTVKAKKKRGKTKRQR